MTAGHAGLWVISGRASVAAIAWACAVMAGVALFVLLHEEPTLRGKFGTEYEEYCGSVRRGFRGCTRGTGRQGAVT